ncbi:MAG: NUDIX domain-containing protein [Limnohabitans sp.]|nr:NUDIX domain-containing protein [Limnohabitans sp.]
MELNSEIIDTPPRHAASVILLRDSAKGLQVLLLRRHQASSVLGGAYVFPGGKLDEADQHPQWLTRLSEDGATLRERLGEPELSPEHAAGLYVAALREAFEECRVLPGQPSAIPVRALQEALAQGQNWSDALHAQGMPLYTEGLVPWSRWITPRQPSVTNKRFDTRFFVSQVPDDQIAEHDNHEATDSVWIQPREALSRYWSGQIEMAPPQIMSLAHLSRHPNAHSALAEARSRLPPVVLPEAFDNQGIRTICYPGDPRHSIRQRAMPGPTRLMFINKRFEPESGLDALFD